MHEAEEAVKRIQQGNESLREDFIESQKAFIFKYTSFICKKNLNWANDDELSIALIAFNKAIDRFENGRGLNFLIYARVLIKNSIIDYFRRQPGLQAVSLEASDSRPQPGEEEISIKHYSRELENRDRVFEIELFMEELSRFGISLAELPGLSPKHGETRKFLKSMAGRIARDEELVQKIYRDRKLPMKEIQLLTGTNRKSLDRWRKYLLVLVIILANPDLEMLAGYIKGEEVET